jgi:PAS domain S-box-containing protein
MANKDKVNILMVDDQPGKLLSYEAILADLGENLVKATSGKQALEHLLTMDVAVVLMDVSMPEMDGFELAEMIREHPRFQKTAIIFISAVHLTDLDRLQGYQRGAVDYSSVPVIPEILRAKVSVFAELHRKTRQLQRLNRDLEKRVEERTEELRGKAEILQRVNYQLAQRNQELDAIVRTVPDMIYSSEPDGGRDYISRWFSEYTGAPSPASIGFGWLDYVHPDDFEQTRGRWLGCVRSGETYETEYRLQGKEGEYRWFRCRAVPIRDESGNILKWYGTCSDIHDSKLLEQSIRDSAVRLERMVDERTAELRVLSSRLMTMQDEERRRIAREMHDGLGQDLAAAKMILESVPIAPSAQSAVDSIDRAIQQVRTLSHLLHPPLLDEVGLISAVRWYLEGLNKRSGIELTLDVQPNGFPRLTPELETAIFRIVQEALTNVFRHSGARKASVGIVDENSEITVRVRDDGKGLDDRVMQFRPDSIGIGLGGMRQRAKEFGGEIRISNACPGTLVEVHIPSSVDSTLQAVAPGRASA